MAEQIRTWDGQSWWLDPGALFLDFVYTGDFGVGPWREGMIHTAGELDAWVAEHVAPDLDPALPAELEQALALRECLTRLVKATAEVDERADDGDASFVSQVASRPDIPPALPGHESEGSLTTGQALSTIARDAVVHLRDHPDRLRNCHGPDCPLIFLDLSRAGKRTWCSMARCGNRAKARAFRSRTSRPKTADKKSTTEGAME